MINLWQQTAEVLILRFLMHVKVQYSNKELYFVYSFKIFSIQISFKLYSRLFLVNDEKSWN